MAQRKVSIGKGVPGNPSTPGSPAGTPTGAKKNWTTGKNIIGRKKVNGTGRKNLWANGGLDG
jgi:hypothetical protein